MTTVRHHEETSARGLSADRMALTSGPIAWFLANAYVLGATGLAWHPPDHAAMTAAVLAVSFTYAVGVGLAARALTLAWRAGDRRLSVVALAAIAALPIVATSWFLGDVVRGIFYVQVGDAMVRTPSVTGLVLTWLLALYATFRARSLAGFEWAPVAAIPTHVVGWSAGVMAMYMLAKPGLDTSAMPFVLVYALFVGLGAAAVHTGRRERRRSLTSIGWVTLAAFPAVLATFAHWMWWMTLTGADIDIGWAPLLPVTLGGFLITYLAGVASWMGLLASNRRARKGTP